MKNPNIKTIYLIRHGETDWNREERFQGHTDIPLNERGREQARKLITPTSRFGIQAILSSDLDRAIETGKIITSNLNVPAFRDPRLREAHLGQAEGMKWTDIIEKFGKETVTRWRSHRKEDFVVGYPDGEDGFQVAKRGFEALRDFSTNQPYEKIAVATHGGVIRRIIHTLVNHAAVEVPIPNLVTYAIQFDTSSNVFQFNAWTPYEV